MSDMPDKYQVQRVATGKRVSLPPPKNVELSNADFIRIWPYGLFELNKRKNDFVMQSRFYNNNYPNTLSKKQIDFLTLLFNGVDQFLCKNPLMDPAKHRVTKALRQDVESIKLNYEGFKKKLGRSRLPKFLQIECRSFIDFVLEFVETFYFHDGLILDIRKIPNRSVNTEIRFLVHQIIEDYQKENGTTKPPNYPYVMGKLNTEDTIDSSEEPLPKIQLSARQYGNFKKWRERGTYWWYIQP